ncbi:MAG: hypothetical protein Q7S22_07315 [Candidatus Micrarchaeota archaeon]|nr:hypothetical protein [Candidatus Micrarchaeota archaeon]
MKFGELHRYLSHAKTTKEIRFRDLRPFVNEQRYELLRPALAIAELFRKVRASIEDDTPERNCSDNFRIISERLDTLSNMELSGKLRKFLWKPEFEKLLSEFTNAGIFIDEFGERVGFEIIHDMLTFGIPLHIFMSESSRFDRANTVESQYKNEELKFILINITSLVQEVCLAVTLYSLDELEMIKKISEDRGQLRSTIIERLCNGKGDIVREIIDLRKRKDIRADIEAEETSSSCYLNMINTILSFGLLTQAAIFLLKKIGLPDGKRMDNIAQAIEIAYGETRFGIGLGNLSVDNPLVRRQFGMNTDCVASIVNFVYVPRRELVAKAMRFLDEELGTRHDRIIDIELLKRIMESKFLGNEHLPLLEALRHTAIE